ncbi:MAG: peroxide stress protein YaaA [Rubrivivax sp.]|nr:peroxide stress protein YaaA [Rubrivivax sp.]
MLYLLSPAKRLDYETPVPAAVERRATLPRFSDRAAELIALLRERSPAQVASLMKLSDVLALLNVGRYAAWQRAADATNSKPALLAFAGDVYAGLQARSLKTADLDWAQRHLVILSGLYGVLRPLDRLQPYRLEMGTALPNAQGKDLYAFWGDRIAVALNEQLAASRGAVVVNLASVEYARAALRPALQARVVECVFEDWKDGRYRVISFFAKRARGLMARWAIEHRVDTPAHLAQFEAEGYAFDARASAPQRLHFRRRVAAA